MAETEILRRLSKILRKILKRNLLYYENLKFTVIIMKIMLLREDKCQICIWNEITSSLSENHALESRIKSVHDDGWTSPTSFDRRVRKCLLLHHLLIVSEADVIIRWSSRRLISFNTRARWAAAVATFVFSINNLLINERPRKFYKFPSIGFCVKQ